ncbi:hypothetical protein D3C81_1077400 [compost metagenome]
MMIPLIDYPILFKRDFLRVKVNCISKKRIKDIISHTSLNSMELPLRSLVLTSLVSIIPMVPVVGVKAMGRSLV